ncbi:MAG: TauD/TfdA family dioxygenase [Burkholderiales bacterium]|nr:TauD/TfdA family dioxygenase [Burkholderiales bacterium]
MQCETMAGGFGVSITGVRVDALDDADMAAVLEAWRAHHGLMVFPRQHVSDAGLLAFSRRLGELDLPPNQENGRQSAPGFPEIYVVSNIKDAAGAPIGALGDGEAVWHTDMSYAPMPPLASMLTAREIPASGGSTWFCDMVAAAAALPADLRARVAGLKVKHDGTYNSGGYLRKGVVDTDDPVSAPGTLHPLLVRIPETGQASLYLGRRRLAYIDGLSRADSEALLDQLWEVATDAGRVYRHQWQLGDLVVWDNRTTMHRRDPFPPSERRLMHRTQIKGAAAPAPFA